MADIALSAATERRLEAMFAPADRSAARDLLVTRCGDNLPNWQGRDPIGLERIRFAVLKLSGGQLEALALAVDVACEDWRDSLVAAGFAHEVRAHENWNPLIS
jgi:hypothetical protein